NSPHPTAPLYLTVAVQRPWQFQGGDVMARMTRRDFLKASGSAAFAVSGLAGCASMGGAPTATTTPSELMPTTGRRVIVVGGGWAGATAAKYVRMEDPSLEVVLIEPNRKFISCPFSNLVLSGVRSIGSLTFGYNGLREQHGVKILHESATAIEPDARRVRLGRGFLTYDRLIVAPGFDFQTEQIEGLAAAGDRVLHAWKVDPVAREVTTEFGDKVRYDVVNVIPPQRAGAIAVQADLVGVDKRWCEVNHVTYESVKATNVHVVGDSTIGIPVPKSGTVANS